MISLDTDEYMIDMVNFLHELEFCKNEVEFKDLTCKEPTEDLTDNKFNYVFAAGVIQFFAARKGYSVPDWVLDYKYRLDNEWFSMEGAKGRARVFIVSPACFAWRNIFIDGDGLIPM